MSNEQQDLEDAQRKLQEDQEYAQWLEMLDKQKSNGSQTTQEKAA